MYNIFLFSVYIFILFFVLQIYNSVLFLIIVPADIYYFEMVNNLYLTNILKYDLSNNFKVIAFTNKMYEKCKEKHIPVDIMDNPIVEDNNSDSYKITSKNYVKKLRIRHPIILKYLLKTHVLLFLDADVFFFQNPLSLLKYFSFDSDLMMPCDNKKCSILNYGFLLIRKTNNSIKYFNELIKIEKNCRYYDWRYVDQNIANRFMRNISYMKIQNMTIDKFMDGYNFFKNYSFKKDIIKTKLIGFHNDFTVGVDSKIYRLKELGLYEYENKLKKYKYNKYIYYNASANNNINITKIMLYLIYLSRKLNRIIILPKFDCKNKRKCSFAEQFNLECFNKCKINYVENISFLFLLYRHISLNTIHSALADILFYSNNNCTALVNSNIIKKEKYVTIIIDRINYIYEGNNNKCLVKDDFFQKRFTEC